LPLSTPFMKHSHSRREVSPSWLSGRSTTTALSHDAGEPHPKPGSLRSQQLLEPPINRSGTEEPIQGEEVAGKHLWGRGPSIGQPASNLCHLQAKFSSYRKSQHVWTKDEGQDGGNRTSLNSSLFSALVLARKAVTCKSTPVHT
jgi:hypothetical protein